MDHKSTRATRTLWVALALFTALASVLAATAAPAGAHGEEGEMTVVRAEQTAPLTIAIDVGLVHADDDHLAEDAEVWVDASTEGSALEPVGLRREGEGSAVYSGEIQVPVAGEWTLRVESSGPDATTTATVTVTEPAAGAPDDDPATTTTAADAGTGADTGEDAAATTDAGTEDDGDVSVVLVVLAVLALIVVGLAGYAAYRRRNPA
jgi:cobalamin biosynthesis Mg chelatase CobN